MNHPNQEEWMPYLFRECRPTDRRRLKAHLQDCAECRDQLKTWQQSLGLLDAWKLPRLRHPAEVLAPWFKWAFAAGLMVCLGFGVGRFTTPRADLQQLRASLEAELRRQVIAECATQVREQVAQASAHTLVAADTQTRQLLAAYAQTLETDHAKGIQALAAGLERLQAQRLADFARLRQDLDTVAVNTDAELRRTERQLVQLADYTPPKH